MFSDYFNGMLSHRSLKNCGMPDHSTLPTSGQPKYALMEYKQSSLGKDFSFLDENVCFPITTTDSSECEKLLFFDDLQKFENSLNIQSDEHCISLMKKIREFLIGHRPNFGELEKFHFLSNLRFYTSNEKSPEVKKYAFECIATCVCAFPNLITKIIDLNLIFQCFDDPNTPLCIFPPIFRLIGNLLYYSEQFRQILFQKISPDKLIEISFKVIEHGTQVNEPITAVFYCIFQIVNKVRFDPQYYFPFAEIFQEKLKKKISAEACSDNSHLYALNGIWDILQKENDDLSDDEKREIIERNHIQILLKSYFEVLGIYREKLACCRIITTFFQLFIPLQHNYIGIFFNLLCDQNFPFRYKHKLLEELIYISLSRPPESMVPFYTRDVINYLCVLCENEKFNIKYNSFILLSRMILHANEDQIKDLFFDIKIFQIFFGILESDVNMFDKDAFVAFDNLISCAKFIDDENTQKILDDVDGYQIMDELMSEPDLEQSTVSCLITIAGTMGISYSE